MNNENQTPSISFAAAAIALLALATSASVGAKALPSSDYAQPAVMRTQDVGAPGLVFRPAGDGPFAAVVLVPDCSGNVANNVSYRDWGSRLAQAGYVALLVGADNTGAVCRSGQPETSAIESARSFLAGDTKVDNDRIGIVGWSRGANTALRAIDASYDNGRFKAAVVFSPDCGGSAVAAQGVWAPYAPVTMVLADDANSATVGACAAQIHQAQRMSTAAVMSVSAEYGEAMALATLERQL